MVNYKDEIKELEDLIAKTKYNKRTQRAIGMYKAKLALLKGKQEARSKSKAGIVDQAYQVRRSGDGTVILLGFPSAGKSTLLNAITNADSEIGAYEFTTLGVIPGTLEYKQAKIQILDVPGIVAGAASGRGRGREVLACMWSADLCLILLDATKLNQFDVIKKEIYDSHVRLGQKKPDVKIRRMIKDGIRIGRTVRTPRLDDVTIKAVMQQYRISNAEVLIRSPINVDQFIDAIQGNKKYMSYLLVINKIDLVDEETKKKIQKKYKPDLFVSAKDKYHIEELKNMIYDRMGLMPIYLKEPGKAADLKEPLIVQVNSTIADVCRKLHKDFVKKFRFARVTGPSAKFEAQKLSLRHKLKADDILEIHIH